MATDFLKAFLFEFFFWGGVCVCEGKRDRVLCSPD